MHQPQLLDIEVIYANPQQQKLIAVKVPQHCDVKTAIELSGILTYFPEINLTQNKVGIFSKIVSLEHHVQAGDRVEIYHSLLIDPKDARKARAKKQKI